MLISQPVQPSPFCSTIVCYRPGCHISTKDTNEKCFHHIVTHCVHRKCNYNSLWQRSTHNRCSYSMEENRLQGTYNSASETRAGVTGVDSCIDQNRSISAPPESETGERRPSTTVGVVTFQHFTVNFSNSSSVCVKQLQLQEDSWRFWWNRKTL